MGARNRATHQQALCKEAHGDQADHGREGQYIHQGPKGGNGVARHHDNGGNRHAERHVVVYAQHIGAQTLVDHGASINPRLWGISEIDHSFLQRKQCR